MRFRFCGDADCSDWVLAEIPSLSRLSSIKLKLLAQAVSQSWDDKMELNISKVQKLLSDAKLDSVEDMKAIIACINFILTSATRHSCDESAFASELQQLGLPQEHSQALKRVYSENSAKLALKLKRESLRVNHLEDTQILDEKLPGCVSLEFLVNGQKKQINIQKSDVPKILTDLKYVLTNIEENSQSQSLSPSI